MNEILNKEMQAQRATQRAILDAHQYQPGMGLIGGFSDEEAAAHHLNSEARATQQAQQLAAIEANREKFMAERARTAAENRLSVTLQALMVHANNDDIAAATSAIAKVAAKAMRRR